jgi:hypothetical protein
MTNGSSSTQSTTYYNKDSEEGKLVQEYNSHYNKYCKQIRKYGMMPKGKLELLALRDAIIDEYRNATGGFFEALIETKLRTFDPSERLEHSRSN